MKRFAVSLCLLFPFLAAAEWSIQVQGFPRHADASALVRCLSAELGQIRGLRVVRRHPDLLVKLTLSPAPVNGIDYMISAILLHRQGLDVGAAAYAAQPPTRVDGYLIDDIVLTLGRKADTGPLCRDLALSVARRYGLAPTLSH